MRPHADSAQSSGWKFGLLASVAILVLALAAGAAWRLAAAANRTSGRSSASWLVLASTREGYSAAYTIRADGSRLTPLLGEDRKLIPIAVSGDGSAVAYGPGEYIDAIYVSRADGTALHRVAHTRAPQNIDHVVLSPDGKKLAYSVSRRLFVVDADGRHLRDLGRGAGADWTRDGTKLVFATAKGCAVLARPFVGRRTRVHLKCSWPRWSPDGSEFVFETKGGCAVVRSPALSAFDWLEHALEGEKRVFVRGQCERPEWSPDGRWIAFEAPGCPYCDSEKEAAAARKRAGVWLVRPSGNGLHRVMPPPAIEDVEHEYAWSPDGSRLAVMDGSKVFVVSLDGHRRRLRLDIDTCDCRAPAWSPDGSRLLLVAHAGNDPDEIWSVHPDGSGLRRLTSAGENMFVGLARLAPELGPAPPLPPSERVLGPTTLQTTRPIGLIAADGERVAYTTGTTSTDCEHASVWTPATKSILRVSRRLPAPCDDTGTLDYTVYELAVAGSFLGWSDVVGCGNSCDTEFTTATLPEARPVLSGEDEGGGGGADGGELTRYGELGHGDTFVFSGTVRVALPGGKTRGCRLRRKGHVDSISGHRIALRGPTGIAVLDDRCSLVRLFPFGKGEVKTALLDGPRLVLSRLGQLEAYDVASGSRVVTRPLPAGYRLTDVDGGIALLHRGLSVLLLRLGDGRTVTFRPCRGPVLADLEGTGLYYASRTLDRGGRLVFVPRPELERRLATGTNEEPRCLRSAASYRTAEGAGSVAIADLNLDGRPDLVTASENGTVSVLLHGGGGTFQARRDYRTRGGQLLAVGDLNGDGAPDVVTVAAYPDRGVASVLLNKGDGSFGAAARYRAGKEAVSVDLGDLDGDGMPDLVVAYGLDSHVVSVFLNRGAGKFAPKVDYRAGKNPNSVALGDVDGDGALDLVAALDLPKGGVVSVLRGKGDGTFGRPRKYPAGEGVTPNSLAIGDVNGNGKPDVVATVGCDVYALLNRGDGTFGGAHELGRPEDCPNVLAVGDLDGDGKPDLVTGASAYPFGDTVTVLLNRGDGRFAAGRTYEGGPREAEATGLAIGDLDGDGRPDLALTDFDAGSVSVLTNTLGACRVRHFRGETVAGAKAALRRAACRVGSVSYAYSARIQRGRVIAPKPRFGHVWPNGPEVDLVVSKGPK